jgi:hypothetical protein
MQGAHPHAITYRALRSEPRLEAPITLVWREGEANPAMVRFADLARSIARRRRSTRSARGRSVRGVS